MKKLFIIANWKSNKTVSQAKEWLTAISNSQRFSEEKGKLRLFPIPNKQIIICPSFTLLSEVKSLITNYQLPITLGAQNISPLDEGPYTGEVNGHQLKEFADYVIIGHSERRKYFGETEEMINKKLKMATKYELTPILCISEINQVSNFQFLASSFQPIVAYEPIFAIGTGNPDTPEEAENITKTIKEKNQLKAVLYGGSVTAENVKSFTTMPSIDGVLVGTASLDSHEFLQIITNS